MTKEKREKILNNYSIRVTCQSDVDRLNYLERSSEEVKYDFHGGWVWGHQSCYYGNNNGKYTTNSLNPWGKFFNSVDKFEAFLKDEPTPSGNKFKVGDKVRIVANLVNHEYKIGSIQEIEAVCVNNNENDAKYRCVYKDGGYWYISGNCAELYEEEPECAGGYTKYREYNGVKYPTDVDEFLKQGPYGSTGDLQSYIIRDEIAGGMPYEQFSQLKYKVNTAHESLAGGLEEFWKERDRGKGLEELLINKKPITHEEAYKICIDKMYKTPLNTSDITLKANPLQELTCKKQKKQLDLSTKKVRREF